MIIEDYEFTKSHTQIAKGVAIILMMEHHLFRFPERLQGVSYISILPYYHNTVEFFIGDFGKICVGMYLFLSGYGLYITYLTKKEFTFRNSVKKMFGLLINYWVVFAIFIPIGLFGYSRDPRYYWNVSNLVKNLLTLSSSYNSEWWFLRLYIELLLLFPIIKYIVRKSALFSLGTSISVYIIFRFFLSLLKLFPQMIFLKNNFIYNNMNSILFWQIVFCVGCIVAKFNLFKNANKYLMDKKSDNNFFYLVGIFLIIAIRINVTKISNSIGKIDATYVDFILVPIFILFCTNVIYKIKSKQIFLVLGKHSTNIWFTHTFFAYYYFQKIIFLPKLSVLILIWLSILTISSSIIINYIIEGFNKLGNYIKLKVNKTISINN